MTAKARRSLFIVLAIALGLRLALLLATLPDVNRAFSNDTHTYFDFARAIMQGKLWTYPSAHRTPGYPLFLAALQLQIVQIILCQIAISVGSVYLTWLLSFTLFKEEKIALISSTLLALSSGSITHSYYLLSETLFTFLFLASMLTLVQGIKRRQTRWIVFSAVWISLAILTRPVALFYPLIMLGFLVWQKVPWKNKLPSILLFSGIVGLMLGIWTIRNAQAIGLPTISTISNTNLLFYNAASLEANQSGRNEQEIRSEYSARIEKTIAENGLSNTEATRSQIARAMAKQIILSAPFQYALIHLRSDINTLLPDTDLLEILGLTAGQKGTLDYMKQHGLWAGIQYYFGGHIELVLLLVPFILILLLTYIGSVIGSLKLYLQHKYQSLTLILLPILYGVLLPGSPSNPRFRVPLMPFFAILAAVGLIQLQSTISGYRHRKKEQQQLRAVPSIE